ncbi:MAG: hypothetical protein K8H86_14785 [Ignavibacteriaceae bacterium]|nr:hypothetical protein [Ignavibacteriaceae bacterium]
MKVTIDGKVLHSTLNVLKSGSASEYFDIHPGKRVFEIFDSTNTSIYKKTIEIISFDRTTIVFDGFYSPDELVSTFAYLEVADGLVYVSQAPKSGNAHLFFVNAAATLDTLEAMSYGLQLSFVATGDTARVDTVLTTALAFEGTKSAGNVVPGNYQVIVTGGTTYTDTLDLGNLTAGNKYYMFFYGKPNDLSVFNNSVVPPPIRSRDLL